MLSIYVGTQNYVSRLEQYSTVSETNRNTLRQSLEKVGWRALRELRSRGFDWTKRPEALSTFVSGLSGKLGQEVHVQHLRLLQFSDSLFAVDSIYALFGMLDFSFVVKIIFSLCTLLLTYDVICGEKETGTLRLCASFPVSKSTIALAKLIGSTLAVLIPFVFGFLLSLAILSLSPNLSLAAADWQRLAALIVVFALYIVVFAAFGIWVSALTEGRLTAFLGLLGLWILWILVVPNLAVRAAQRLAPVQSIYELEKRGNALRWEVIKSRDAAQEDYLRGIPGDSFDSLPKEQQIAIRQVREKIDEKWDREFYSRLKDLQEQRRNQIKSQHRLVMIFSSISPLGAVSFLSMDLARTGFVQQKQIENALSTYLSYVAEFIRANRFLSDEEKSLTDFALFSYRDDESLAASICRNLPLVLNLVLLSLLGFAGAYVAFLRYDVR